MDQVLEALKDPSGEGAKGLESSGLLAPFGDVCDAVGFNEYYAREEALREEIPEEVAETRTSLLSPDNFRT